MLREDRVLFFAALLASVVSTAAAYYVSDQAFPVLLRLVLSVLIGAGIGLLTLKGADHTDPDQ